ncbi:hypothetical protein CEXT_93181, partial [Caerostris extrusa]
TAKWTQLNEICGGDKQSPIDIDTGDTLKKAFLKPVVFKGYDKPLKKASDSK